MTTMLIAQNETRESGSFMGDQLCSLKAAYMFVRSQLDVDRVVMSVSPGNEMDFVWHKFVSDFQVELVHDTFNPGDWPARWSAWDKWRSERSIAGIPFDHYRELYLRIHGAQRQVAICGHERGLGRRNIYEYWVAGQENLPTDFRGSDVYDVEIYHPPLTAERDVYISPHCKTQGNHVFTFDFWSSVVHLLVDAEVSVTVGYDGAFCEDLNGRTGYSKHWGDHRQWVDQVCRHKLVACGNTGSGWLAAACGVPLITMEPHNSVMADHRYRECGLRNLVEVVDGARLDSFNGNMERVANYVATRIIEFCHSGDQRRRDRMLLNELCQTATQHSVNPPRKLRILADELLSVKDVAGDVADLGSYRGGTAMVLRKLAPDKRLHLYDTWDGTPHDDPLCHHKHGCWKASLEDCQKVVGNGDLTYYWDGIFPESAGESQERTFAFVYVDMDTYQSTCAAIEFFWPRMVVGGKMVFDDFGWEPCAGVEKAVREMFSNSLSELRVVGNTCIVEKR